VSDVLLDTLAAFHASIPIHVSKLVPLHRHYAPTGAVMADVACVRVGDRLYFHPQRLAELRAVLANPRPTAGEFARWDDDGGAQR
jgi:hypothetical protein